VINLTAIPTIQNAVEVLEVLRMLARDHPGQPVALMDNGEGEVEVSILNIFPGPEDWYSKPVPLSSLVSAIEQPASLK
jgi:FixJ family two-component response regulator